MSSRKLSSAEEEVPRSGLNFAPTPSRLPLIVIAAAIKEGVNKLEDDATYEFRGRICGIIRGAKLPVDNLS